jgi:hypothetical protein
MNFRFHADVFLKVKRSQIPERNFYKTCKAESLSGNSATCHAKAVSRYFFASSFLTRLRLSGVMPK